jgi:hypothetical protein
VLLVLLLLLVLDWRFVVVLAGNRKWCGVRWFPRFVFLFSSTSAWTTAFRFGFVFGSLDVALVIGHFALLVNFFFANGGFRPR